MPLFREWCCGNKEKRLCSDKALECWSYLIILCGHTFSARHGVGVGAGQPVEEALDFQIPEAPLVAVLLGLIPRHLAAELDQAVAELDVGLIEEILLSAGEIALGELFPFGSKLFGKRGRVEAWVGIANKRRREVVRIHSAH